MRTMLVGLGRMGSWLAREMLADGHQVGVFDTRPDAVAPTGTRVLEEIKAIADFCPQMLVNAVGIQETIPVFRELEGFLPPDCLLVDITSVKNGLADYYALNGRPFVSIHPMFGPRFADLDGPAGENLIIIKESDQAGFDYFRSFCSARGLRCWELYFADHDRMMGYSLTLPFAATISLAACIRGDEVPGTTFARHRELARNLLQEDDQLLIEILFNPHSLEQLERICGRLQFLKHVIAARDRNEAEKFLASLRGNIKAGESNKKG